MGESVSTESQPSKLCSWILFPYGLAVKGKSDTHFFGRNLLLGTDLREQGFFDRFPQNPKTLHFSPEDIALR
jgi:hypothetical protein